MAGKHASSSGLKGSSCMHLYPKVDRSSGGARKPGPWWTRSEKSCLCTDSPHVQSGSKRPQRVRACPEPTQAAHFYNIHITLILHETSGSVWALAWGWDGKLLKTLYLLTRHFVTFCIKWTLWHIGGGIFPGVDMLRLFWVEWSAEYFKIPSVRKEKPWDKHGSRSLNYLITLTALVLIYYLIKVRF